MKLTLKIKLLPNPEQVDLLLQTIKEANAVCNAISSIAWEQRTFNQFKLHHLVYHPFRKSFNLSSAVLVRCIAKVSHAFRMHRKKQCKFNLLGAIEYDKNILTYKPNDTVSIWCIGGRQIIPFICHNRNYLPFIKGEAHLVFKKNKFYLFQTVDIPDAEIDDVEEFIGVDFGLTDIVVTSDETKHPAEELNQYREQRQKVRSSLQRKGTSGAKKLLKRLSGRERTHVTIVNHTIAKSLIKSALSKGNGLAIEDLTHIRTSKRRNKKFRTKLGKWPFYQLRSFIEYKAKLNGVKVVIIDPHYTSQTCNVCKHIGKRTNKKFTCSNCGAKLDADFNAALNIASLGAAIHQPEKSAFYCQI